VCKKCSAANCGLKQLKFDTTWANRAELGIRELKKGTRRKMRAARSPLRLWDCCGKLEARVRSNTAHCNPLLNRQVPETLVLGKTSDILDIAEFGWYEWICCRDTRSQIPNNNWTYERWSGLAPTIGGAMGMNVLQPNSQIVIHTTLCKLNKAELTDEKEVKLRDTIYITIKEKLGKAMKPSDFPSHNTLEW